MKQLDILVGQQGGASGGPHGNENGGGGGTFVVQRTGNVPLVIAGGGGGAPSSGNGTSCSRSLSTGDGQAGTSGVSVSCYTNAAGGSGGGGGAAGGSEHGGAGGGFSGVEVAAAPVGLPVRGELDWARRRQHMAQHTAQHLLSGALLEHAQAPTVSARLGENALTIDVARDRIPEAELAATEALANDLIDEDLPIRAWFPAAEELAQLSLRRDPKVDDNIRIVAIGDFDGDTIVDVGIYRDGFWHIDTNHDRVLDAAYLAKRRPMMVQLGFARPPLRERNE